MGNYNVVPRWKKGESGNPGGRPKISDELKAIKRLTGDELHRRIMKYLRMSGEDLKETMRAFKEEEKNALTMSSIDLMICSIIVQGIVRGDETKLEFLISRCLGKVPVGDKLLSPPTESDRGPWDFSTPIGPGNTDSIEFNRDDVFDVS